MTKIPAPPPCLRTAREAAVNQIIIYEDIRTPPLARRRAAGRRASINMDEINAYIAQRFTGTKKMTKYVVYFTKWVTFNLSKLIKFNVIVIFLFFYELSYHYEISRKY